MREIGSVLLVRDVLCFWGVARFDCGGTPPHFFGARAVPFACDSGFFKYSGFSGVVFPGLADVRINVRDVPALFCLDNAMNWVWGWVVYGCYLVANA